MILPPLFASILRSLKPIGNEQFLYGEIAFLLQIVQKWINRARTHFVAVAPKLFNHPEAHQRLLCGVMENVQADKTADKLTVIRLFKFSVEGLSTHSCNPQRTILTTTETRIKYNRPIHYRISLLTGVSLHVQSRSVLIVVAISRRPGRSPMT